MKSHSFAVFAALALVVGMATTSQAAIINVADSQFDSASGGGSVGGSVLVNGTGTSQIGSTPWYGTYSGLKVGFLTLAAPTLTIGNGMATISGVSSLGTQQNGGYFSQTLGSSYVAGTTYTLAADVTTSSALGTSLFGNTGVGIALTDASGAVLASTSDGTAISSVTGVGGTTYHLTLSFLAGTSTTGLIGVRLFDLPSGIANLNMQNSVSFDNITLNSAIVPTPSSLALLGLGLVGTIGQVLARRGRVVASLT